MKRHYSLVNRLCRVFEESAQHPGSYGFFWQRMRRLFQSRIEIVSAVYCWNLTDKLRMEISSPHNARVVLTRHCIPLPFLFVSFLGVQSWKETPPLFGRLFYGSFLFNLTSQTISIYHNLYPLLCLDRWHGALDVSNYEYGYD